MSGFDNLVLVEKISNRPKPLWRLDRDLVYHSDLLEATVVVPKDFVTDFASVPRLLVAYSLFGGKGDEAAVVHDWLYSARDVGGRAIDRATADAVFQEALKSLGYSAFTSTFMYSGVRAGGWLYWDSPNIPQFETVTNKMPGVFPEYSPG